jgi:hypothetical protein
VTPKDGDLKRLEEALGAFAKMSDEAYKKTARTWEKRLKRMPTIKGGTPQFPELHFDWLLDEKSDKSRIFFISAKTPSAWKFFGLGKRKMEKELKNYLKDIQKIDVDCKFIGD